MPAEVEFITEVELEGTYEVIKSNSLPAVGNALEHLQQVHIKPLLKDLHGSNIIILF